MIIDSRVINIMDSTSQDGGEDFKIGKDRLNQKDKRNTQLSLYKKLVVVVNLIDKQCSYRPLANTGITDIRSSSLSHF